MNDNELVDMICRDLFCQWKMVMDLLVVLDLYSTETVVCLVELWQWAVNRLIRAISFHLVLGLLRDFYLWNSIVLWTYIRTLWYYLWLEVLLYLLSVAWNLQRRWQGIFSLVLSVLKYPLCPKNEVILEYSIFFDQSLGAIWFLIRHQKGLPIKKIPSFELEFCLPANILLSKTFLTRFVWLWQIFVHMSIVLCIACSFWVWCKKFVFIPPCLDFLFQNISWSQWFMLYNYSDNNFIILLMKLVHLIVWV